MIYTVPSFDIDPYPIVSFVVSTLLFVYYFRIDSYAVWYYYWKIFGKYFNVDVLLPKPSISFETWHDVEMKVRASIERRNSAKLKRLINITNPLLKWRFEHAWSEIPHASPVMVFHGTSPFNIPSIARRGLLVPGLKSGIRVANGSAHGVGIYLASEAATSMGYTRNGCKLLVCALLQHSKNVKHHSGIYVATDEKVVLPCFIAEYEHNYPNSGRRIVDSPLFLATMRRIWDTLLFAFALSMLFQWTASLGMYMLGSNYFGDSILLAHQTNSYFLNWILYSIFWIVSLPFRVVYNILYFIYFLGTLLVTTGPLNTFYEVMLETLAVVFWTIGKMAEFFLWITSFNFGVLRYAATYLLSV